MNIVKGVLHLRTLAQPLGTWFVSTDAVSLKGVQGVSVGTLVLLEI